MNKKLNIVLVSLLVAIILIPQMAFASWWNPFSWKVFNKKVEISSIAPATTTQTINTFVEQPINSSDVSTTNVVNEVKSEDISKLKKEIKKQQIDIPAVIKKTDNQIKKIAPIVSDSKKIIDVCLNIEGIQSQTPNGYSSISNICTLINVKDYCPNIEGVQSKIPDGMFLYKNTNECLTENEIDAIESKKYEKSQESENINNNVSVDSKTEKIKAQIITYIQKLDVQIAELNQKIAIADAVAKNTASSPTSGCQGTKTSNGCEASHKTSFNVGSAVDGSILAQLSERKNSLNDIYNKLKTNDINEITTNDKETLTSVGISL